MLCVEMLSVSLLSDVWYASHKEQGGTICHMPKGENNSIKCSAQKMV